MNRSRTDAAGSLHVEVTLALDRFQLEVAFETSRQVTGVFGPSGSGKTSLLETLVGMRRQARGTIRLDGERWLDSKAGLFVRPEGREIGYVPQDGLLFPHKNVKENLLAGGDRALRNGHPLEETLETVADLLDLRPLFSRSVATLSGGERQRVALGRAICSGPRLLLLDEPLASLDLPLRRKLLPFLRRVRREFRIPMILVSHDPLEVQALCDDLIVLSRGVPIARGEPREVLTNPEIFPLAEREGFENILPGRMAENGDRTSRIVLESEADPAPDPAVELVTMPSEAPPGGSVLVGVPANEVLIATRRPEGLSARNVLPATVAEIRSTGAVGLVVARLAEGIPPVLVEVTDTTPARLGLRPGSSVFLVIKATSCRLYGGS